MLRYSRNALHRSLLQQRIRCPSCAELLLLLCVLLACAVLFRSMWFALVEVIMLLAGRNFMMDYLQDWNPKEVRAGSLIGARRFDRRVEACCSVCLLVHSVHCWCWAQ